jgi:hypothetical protein
MSTQQLTPRVTAAGSGIGRASGFELTSPGAPGAAIPSMKPTRSDR